jgi:hypothetical protein
MTLLEGSRTIAGIKLRPFSFGTLEACERLKLTLFTSPAGAAELLPSEVRRQIVAFAWVQSADPETVCDAMTDGNAERLINRFQFTLGVDCVDELIAEVTRIASAVKSVGVEVMPKPGRGNEETPPPN